MILVILTKCSFNYSDCFSKGKFGVPNMFILLPRLTYSEALFCTLVQVNICLTNTHPHCETHTHTQLSPDVPMTKLMLYFLLMLISTTTVGQESNPEELPHRWAFMPPRGPPKVCPEGLILVYIMKLVILFLIIFSFSM